MSAPQTEESKFLEIFGKYPPDLRKFIKSNNDTSKWLFIFAFFTIIFSCITIIALIVMYWNKNPMPDVKYLIASTTVFIFLFTAAIVSLKQSGQSSKSADKYRNELIVIRDLLMAIELAEKLDDSTIKKIPKTEIINDKVATTGNIDVTEPEKTNAMKEIIETLLNRCNS